MTPLSVASKVLRARHAFVPWPSPCTLELVLETCQSFALDNGAFTAWKQGTPIAEWAGYYEWVDVQRFHPGFDFAVIPDVVDSGELERLERLCLAWPRVALGSSGHWAIPNLPDWWVRMSEAMSVACDERGRPKTRLHGLRMLDPRVFSCLPLSSADSTNIARNHSLRSGLGWALAKAEQIDGTPSASTWDSGYADQIETQIVQTELF